MNAWLHAEPWSARSRKLFRGDVSNITSVGETYSNGISDRDLESVRTLSERKDLHVYIEQKADLAVQQECAALRRLSDAEADMETRKWEKTSSDLALYETNRELESRRLELYQAHQWADQAQRERINLYGVWRRRNEKPNFP